MKRYIRTSTSHPLWDAFYDDMVETATKLLEENPDLSRKQLRAKTKSTVAKHQDYPERFFKDSAAISDMLDDALSTLENSKYPFDLSKYGKYEQLELLWTYNAGLDYTWLENPDYWCGQMEQIRYGLESGIDVSQYADPSIPYNKMEEIRWKLEKEKYDTRSAAETPIIRRNEKSLEFHQSGWNSRFFYRMI